MSKRVFFSFHYQDVIDFRANVVRQHKLTKNDNAGYFDASIWEEAKKTGEIALKRLINDELKNTSVTAVLIGTDTYDRRWVRYEIVKSLSKGNSILGIHINNIPGKDQKTKSSGLNPFDYLGIQYNSDGTRVDFYEYRNNKWVLYKDLDGYTISKVNDERKGKFFKLSYFYNTYDWILDKGYDNFSNWIK
ncbi:TIR domain-containing protein [Paenibacillus sp. WQ 127069]|uniref:TIR domain-containing protein n=1 Tax=Paenibacillus baimaensis TaxID=2982185 RepID=A0ABT2UHG5_9BACL|nr:TIR domain-containing protein [Paenibacillus sp. WQ 127069]MCU6793332.1 TIR domain-containing protein [Paenibacillus sp. WQ 127069]